MSLVFVFKELLFVCGRNLRKWKYRIFLFVFVLVIYCSVEVFCFLEYNGYEKIFWFVYFWDEWFCCYGNCVIRVFYVIDSMRWGFVFGIVLVIFVKFLMVLVLMVFY